MLIIKKYNEYLTIYRKNMCTWLYTYAQHSSRSAKNLSSNVGKLFFKNKRHGLFFDRQFLIFSVSKSPSILYANY